MKDRQTDIALFTASVFCFLLLSVSFLLMPLGDGTSNEKVFTLISGIIFWLSLFGGFATQILLKRRRRHWLVKNKIRRSRIRQKIGLFSVFKNKAAAVADITAILSLIAFVITAAVLSGRGYICYLLLSVFIFSFSMHCILNGKIYTYIINQNKLLESSKPEQANNFDSGKDKGNG